MEQKDSNTQKCHPCIHKNVSSAAINWCKNCNEAFCGSCLEVHNFMKITKNHTIIKIENVSDIQHGIDLSAISDACTIHSSKTVEAYCFDHTQLCCVLCLTLLHRKCENVWAIEDLPNLQKNGTKEFEMYLRNIQVGTETLLKQKEQGIEMLKISFTEIKKLAVQSVKLTKEKLDSLLVLFLEELSMIQNDNIEKVQTSLTLVKKFLSGINDVQNLTKVITKHGSEIQLFIHKEKRKPEIELAVKEIMQNLSTEHDLEVNFELDKILKQVLDRDCIGEILIVERNSQAIKEYKSNMIGKDSTVDVPAPIEKHYLTPNLRKLMTESSEDMCDSEIISNHNDKLGKTVDGSMEKKRLPVTDFADEVMRGSCNDVSVTITPEHEMVTSLGNDLFTIKTTTGQVSKTSTDSFNANFLGIKMLTVTEQDIKLVKDSIESFERTNLKLKKVVTIDGCRNLCGGLCVSDENVIVCDNNSNNVKVVDISNGKVISEVSCKGPKRLSFDEQTKTLFISCYNGYFFMYKLETDMFLSMPKRIKGGSPRKGGHCIYDGYLYIIAGNEIQKMKLNSKGGLQTCFRTNTVCVGLNGLAIDQQNKCLIHTTGDFKVVSTTLEGIERFSYKGVQMQTFTSVTVNSDGLIFVGDENGSVHLISEDGKKSKAVITMFQKIQRLCDIWLDKSEKTVFICGDQFVEMYDILC